MTKQVLVHALFCGCMAVVAAEPALVQAVPALASLGPVVLALCAAVCNALHFWDPADASLPTQPAVKQ